LGLFLAVLALFRGCLREEELCMMFILGIGWFCSPVLLAVLFVLPAYAYEYIRAPALEPEGLVALDTLQRRRRVPWNKVYAAKTQSLGGLPEVAISVQGAFWRVRVPLYLQKRTRFESLLVSYAGAQHPIAQAVCSEA
jgi:hypothetical protein